MTSSINPKKHKPSPVYARKLVDRIGQPQGAIAMALSIDPRTFRRYLQEPETKGATPMPYTVQVLLELMAAGQLIIE